MKQSILTGLSALLLAVLLPMALLTPVEADPAEDTLLIIEEEPISTAAVETETEPKVSIDQTATLRIKTSQGVETMTLGEYLTGVVLAEMPASFSLEALKAQAVAARTFSLRQAAQGKHDDCDLCTDSACCQAWTSRSTLQEKLGEAWSGYWEKAAKAVSQTDGEVLTYGGALIDAVYFSCSGGSTEAAVAVWGSEVPYLQPVDSAGEESAARYSSEVSVSLDQFRTTLTGENGATDLSGPASGWFGQATYSQGGGVYTMEIGGQTFYGTRLRTLFGLNSTLFTVAVTRDSVVFEVLGFGHRVGMSQYGANAMALEGKTYDEILHHYYTDVVLEKAPQP